MPRSQANLHFDVFEGLAAAAPLEKLLYVRLLAEQHMNQAGVGPIRLSKWARDLGLPVAQVHALMRGLEVEQFAYFDEDADEFLVRTLVRRDGVADIPNVLHSACRCAKLLRSPKLRRVLAAELRKLPPQPPPKPMPTAANPDRMYIYPDPHGTAAAIDPGPIPDDPLDPDREPLPRRSHGINGTPAPVPASHPIDLGSASHGDGMPDEGAAAALTHEYEIPSRSHGGGGGGGGGGNTPVGRTQSAESACSQAREGAPAHTRTREGAPAAEVLPALPGERQDRPRPVERPARGPKRRGGAAGVAARYGPAVHGPSWRVTHAAAERNGIGELLPNETFRALCTAVEHLLAGNRGAGYTEEQLTEAATALLDKGLHPNALPSVLTEVLGRKPALRTVRGGTTTEDKVEATAAAFDRYLADNGGVLPSFRRRTGGS